MNWRLITPLNLCIVLAACSHAPTKETTEAIGALKKIQAGTQVGINYQEYGRLLIEAKAKVNDALPSLAEGKLKEELSGAMDAYADAAQCVVDEDRKPPPEQYLRQTDHRQVRDSSKRWVRPTRWRTTNHLVACRRSSEAARYSTQAVERVVHIAWFRPGFKWSIYFTLV
jgi:hypothetical protein